MRVVLAVMAVVFLAAHGLCLGAGYEITKVIEVGPLNRSPMIGPMKWSPDGNQVAYFAFDYLMLTDTLGKAKQVCKLDGNRRRFEWLSDREVLICTRQEYEDTIQYKLVQVDVTTGDQSVIRQYRKGLGQYAGPDQTPFNGPYLTVEGNVYYFASDKSPKKMLLPTGKYGKRADPTSNSVYRMGSDGLYVVRVDGQDSVKAFSKPYADTVTGYDRTHKLIGGVLYDLRDSTIVVLAEQIGDYPEGTKGCGCSRSYLSPTCPEVLFNIGCDDGVDYVVDRIATYDYTTGTLTVLDTLIGISNCMSPAYSPDGRNIAFFADSKLYLIMREGTPCTPE